MWYFVVGFAVDVIGAYYSCSVAKGSAQPAGVASAFLFMSGILMNRHLSISFESLPLIEVAAAGFGYYVGTVVTVRWFHRTKENEEENAG